MKAERVGILYHPMREATHTLAKEVGEFLTSRGLSVWLHSAWEWEKAKAQVGGTDLILSIGGDGTILRAAQVAIQGVPPIVGINLGKLGFMTELNVDEALSKLPDLLEGDGWIDERSLLEVELSPSEGKSASLFFALNDIVVARGAVVRIIHVEAIINGETFTTYRADGVIVATATGSTSYALAVGGPILHPNAKEFLLSPISPHLSPAYSLVLPNTATVKLGVSAAYPATLSVDGHINLPLQTGATITIRRSSNIVRFLRTYPENSFYSSLERKLKGKQ